MKKIFLITTREEHVLGYPYEFETEHRDRFNSKEIIALEDWLQQNLGPGEVFDFTYGRPCEFGRYVDFRGKTVKWVRTEDSVWIQNLEDATMFRLKWC
jgi:hypothetical protein